MQIKFRGNYDKRLFFQTVQLTNSPAGRKQWIRPVLLTAILVVLTILVINLVSTRDIMGNASYIVLVALTGSFTVRTYLLPYYSAKKMWANPALQEELKGTISMNGIVYDLPNGKNEMRWNRFIRVRVKKEVVALVRADGLLLIFPKRFFKGDPDWQKFNNLIKEKLPIIK
jgi:hypothetical protein